MSNTFNNKVRIMFIIDHLYGTAGGGAEKHLFYLTNLLDKNKFDVVIVAFDTMDTPFVLKMKEHGIKIIHIPVGKYYTINAINKSIKLIKLIKKMKIDIVQTYHFKADTLGALSAKIAGIKHIISSKRDIGDRKKKIHFYLNRIVNRFVNNFIVVADRVGKVVAHQEKVSENKLKTIYNGVDIQKYHPVSDEEKKAARKSIGLEEDDFIIGMVAVIRPEKNHDIFLDSFKKVLTHSQRIKGLIVGDGKLKNELQDYCKNNGIENQIVFTGASLNVEKYLKTMDVGCLVPGSNEGFSNAILEKMAMGLPMIVTDIGGNSEAVEDGVNGFVIPPNDSTSLANSIIHLYEKPGTRKKMGVASRKRVEEKFSIQKMIDEHNLYYNKILLNNA